MDDNFPTVRKSLNILSVLILVLAFSNAQISKIDFLGIELQLDGDKFYLGVFALYVYFIWRFITKLPFRSDKGFIASYHDFLLRSKDGLLSHYSYDTVKPQLKSKSQEFKRDLQSGVLVPVGVEITRLQNRRLNEVRFIYKYYLNLPIEEGGNQYPDNNKYVFLDIKVNWVVIVMKFFRFCFLYDKFGDYLFPLIPVFINLLFFLLSKEWQGGLQQLVS